MGDGEGALDQYWAALKANYRQEYSEVAADHMVFPRNSGELIDHNAFGIINDDADETMAIWLKIEDGKIANAAFCGDTCVTCTACGSAITELARGKTVAGALQITPQIVRIPSMACRRKTTTALHGGGTLQMALRAIRDIGSTLTFFSLALSRGGNYLCA
jgi:nitrogen fixation NifU-like protein